MYIAPSSGHISLNFDYVCLIGSKEVWGCFLMSGLWSENAALFERMMEIHSNSPILYYGFKLFLILINCLHDRSFHLSCLNELKLLEPELSNAAKY